VVDSDSTLPFDGLPAGTPMPQLRFYAGKIWTRRTHKTFCRRLLNASGEVIATKVRQLHFTTTYQLTSTRAVNKTIAWSWSSVNPRYSYQPQWPLIPTKFICDKTMCHQIGAFQLLQIAFNSGLKR